MEIIIACQYEEKRGDRWAKKGASYHKIELDSDLFCFGFNYDIEEFCKGFLLDNDACRETIVDVIPMFSCTDQGDVTDRAKIYLEKKYSTV